MSASSDKVKIMSRRTRVWIWIVGIIIGAGILAYILGPVLFASIAYPLPDKYRASIAQHAQEYNLSPNFLSALIFTESNFNPNARSGAGAIGMTQFVPSTAVAVAKRLGVQPFTPTDLVKNPDLAIRFGAYYISQGIGQYEGNKRLALIAYNGGGGVANYVRAGGRSPGPEAYASKILTIERAYDTIYGHWWEAAASSGFNVEPKRDLGIIRVISIQDFWQTLFFNRSIEDTTPSTDLNNFWQNLVPSS